MLSDGNVVHWRVITVEVGITLVGNEVAISLRTVGLLGVDFLELLTYDFLFVLGQGTHASLKQAVYGSRLLMGIVKVILNCLVPGWYLLLLRVLACQQISDGVADLLAYLLGKAVVLQFVVLCPFSSRVHCSRAKCIESISVVLDITCRLGPHRSCGIGHRTEAFQSLDVLLGANVIFRRAVRVTCVVC